ncbi:MAG: signal peptidase I [Ruminiclostridium sp.]|nr:signal peptidase I [Ruminiclostridium sp.]
MEKKTQNKVIREVIEWFLYLFSAFIIASILHTQVFAMTVVDQSSMEDTLIEGQKLVMERISYKIHEPMRGDIIVFLQKEETDGILERVKIFFNDIRLKLKKQNREDRMIKRVIAVGGDELTIKGGYVYVNGEKMEEQYIKTLTPNEIVTEIVPEGYVYVMGDNRAISEDSRYYGPIKLDHIEGKVVFRLLPINEMGKP